MQKIINLIGKPDTKDLEEDFDSEAVRYILSFEEAKNGEKDSDKLMYLFKNKKNKSGQYVQYDPLALDWGLESLSLCF